jgi:hypothetical protein
VDSFGDLHGSSSGDITAVGYRVSYGWTEDWMWFCGGDFLCDTVGGAPFARHWDGSGWADVPYAAMDRSPTSVFALDASHHYAIDGQGLGLWDGQAWSAFGDPLPSGAYGSRLFGPGPGDLVLPGYGVLYRYQFCP